MSNFFDSISQEVPWLFPVLAWIGGLILVILLLAIPSYFVFLPFFKKLKEQMASFIERLLNKFKSIRSDRTNRLDLAADEFLYDGGLVRLETGVSGHWTELKKEVLNALQKLQSTIKNIMNVLNNLGKRVLALEEQIKNSEVSKLQDLTLLPEPSELAHSVATNRVAWMRLIITTIILLGLMIVNTGMLSEILVELGVVPPALTFLGLKLAYVFAFILTMVEAGLGVAHAATRSDNPEKILIFPIVLTILAIIAACVEGFFYSRVAPNGTFTLPLLGYQMGQNDLFFFWGFVLVMTLFSLGLIAFDAGEIIVRGTPSRTLRREFKKLKKVYDKYEKRLKHSEEALVSAKKTASNADQIIQGSATNSESVHEELLRVSEKIENLKKQSPEWVKDIKRPLTRSEIYDLALKGGFWFLLLILGFGAIIVTGLNVFESFYPSLKPLLFWVLAIGQASAFLTIGLLLGLGETIVQNTDDEQKVWAAPQFSRLTAYILGCAILIVYTAIFFFTALPAQLGVLWSLTFIIGLFLVAVGYQLMPLLNVMRLWFWRLLNAIIIIFQMIWLALMRFIQFVAVILESLSYLFALPLINYFKRKKQLNNNEI